MCAATHFNRITTLVLIIIVFQNVFSCVEKSFEDLELSVLYQNDTDDPLTDGDAEHHNLTVNGCFKTEDLENATSIQSTSVDVIPVLKRNAFSGLLHLEIIILKEHRMKFIEPGAFNNLPSIYEINLEYNRLYEVKRCVFNHLPVRFLQLGHNRIRNIEPGAFDDMPQLDIIHLQDNELNYWYSSFKNSPNLKFLFLWDNIIQGIPAYAFVHTPNLQEIQMTNNLIERIHYTAFEGLHILKSLDLSKNQIRQLPANMLASLVNLEYLHLNHNNISYIPDSMHEHMKNLNSISLHSNPWQCSCWNKTYTWLWKREIEIDWYYSDCINKANPLCVDNFINKNECIERYDSDFLDLFYKNFEFSPSDCDSPEENY